MRPRHRPGPLRFCTSTAEMRGDEDRRLGHRTGGRARGRRSADCRSATLSLQAPKRASATNAFEANGSSGPFCFLALRNRFRSSHYVNSTQFSEAICARRPASRSSDAIIQDGQSTLTRFCVHSDACRVRIAAVFRQSLPIIDGLIDRWCSPRDGWPGRRRSFGAQMRCNAGKDFRSAAAS
jgi:hypothetical protein